MGIRISQHESVTLDVEGAELTLSPIAIARLWIEKIQRKAAASLKDDGLRIGDVAPGHGGIFVGIGRNAEGRCYRLFVAAEEFGKASFDTQKTRAAALAVEGHADFECPTRRDQALCFANVPELFKSEWYWSQEQYAPFPGCAWAQGFDNGTQRHYDEVTEFRARAVRRELID